jgi:hypothetical protein
MFGKTDTFRAIILLFWKIGMSLVRTNAGLGKVGMRVPKDVNNLNNVVI